MSRRIPLPCRSALLLDDAARAGMPRLPAGELCAVVGLAAPRAPVCAAPAPHGPGPCPRHVPPVFHREVTVMTVPTREEIVAQLAEILHEVAGVVPATVTEEKSLVEELDVDSLAMAEVVVVAEERFGIALPEEEMKDMRTVLDIVIRVEKQLAS
ncbi:hypothetical protein HOK021_01500 [Streptomyces hygroscopicus]|nr:hypothetical protein HOK021_01500 [Streptomyces hygroscopicus]